MFIIIANETLRHLTEINNPSYNKSRLFNKFKRLVELDETPRLILRRTTSSSTEVFASGLELFDNQVADRDLAALKEMWIHWLGNADYAEVKQALINTLTVSS